MAEHDCKSEPTISKIQREALVGYRPNQGKRPPFPQVVLSGRWLEEAGFTTGTKIDVQVTPGCVVMTPWLPDPDPEPEIVAAARRASGRLSASRQRMIVDFIEHVSTPGKRTAK